MTITNYLTFFLIPFFLLLYVILWVINRSSISENTAPENTSTEVTADELERSLQLMLQTNVITQQEYNNLLVKSLPYSR